MNRASTTLNIENELELGVTESLGVFDPLGWLETEPAAFERKRAVERKHGCLAMAAIIETIVHNNHMVFDGYISTPKNLNFPDILTRFAGVFRLQLQDLPRFWHSLLLLSLHGFLLLSMTVTMVLDNLVRIFLIQRRKHAS